MSKKDEVVYYKCYQLGEFDTVVKAEDYAKLQDRLLAADAKLNEPVGEIKSYGVGPDGVYEWPRAGALYRMVHYSDHLKAMSARVPEGYLLIGPERTQKMIEAGLREYDKNPATAEIHVKKIFEAMLAASPKPE